MKTIPLEYNHFYHIYNRGINGCNLFQETENYEYFLYLYDKYISPVADTFAWVLMRNHFHLLVRIKSVRELNLQGFENLEGLKGTNRNLANQQFSNLFNAYTKAINKRFHRTGSLFEHSFRRIKVESGVHLKYLIYYIHHNPIHHGFCEHFLDYPWSSYVTMLSPKTTKLSRKEVLNWFNDESNFKKYHSLEQIEKYNKLKMDQLNDS
ncbi:MAG: transposase [Draconibacterium sp.]|jgi:REP element-mobilizing transposase RayT